MEWDALGRLRGRCGRTTIPPVARATTCWWASTPTTPATCGIQKVVTNSGGLNGTTRFFHEGWRVLEERDGSDAVTNQYVYGTYLDEVWTLDDRRSGGTVASLNDHTGSNRHFYLANTLYHVYGLTNEGLAPPPALLRRPTSTTPTGGTSSLATERLGFVVTSLPMTYVLLMPHPASMQANTSPQVSDLMLRASCSVSRIGDTSPKLGRFLSRDPAGNIAIVAAHESSRVTPPQSTSTPSDCRLHGAPHLGHEAARNLLKQHQRLKSWHAPVPPRVSVEVWTLQSDGAFLELPTAG